MKEGWKYERLGDICISLKDGDWIEKKDQSSSGIRLIQTGNIGISTFRDKNDSAHYISFDTFSRLHCEEVFTGDILISRLPQPVGRACIVPEMEGRCITAVDCSIVKLDYTKIRNAYFLLYAQSQEYFNNIESLCTGTTRQRISRKKLTEVRIPLPSLPEQQKIVDFLDAEFEKIDQLKSNAEAQLQAAKDLFQAALRDLLTPKEGWHIVKIGDLFKTYAGGTPLSSKKEYYTNGNIPWINSGEVCQKYIETTKNFITELGLNNSSAKYYPANTVLIALYGATAAQSGILKFEATSNQAVCGLLPNEKMLPEFVYYWFVLNKMKFSAMAQGGAQPNLSQIKVKAMHIPEIPLKEQTIICDKLSQIEEKVQQLQQNYNKTITLCNDLKQALLKSIFE